VGYIKKAGAGAARLRSARPHPRGRRDPNHALATLCADHDPGIGEDRKPLAQRRRDAAAEEHGEDTVGDAVREEVVHVWARHAARETGQCERSEAPAAERPEPHLRRPEEQRSTSGGRDDLSISGDSTPNVRALDIEDNREPRGG
jgi:hypothetical protein